MKPKLDGDRMIEREAKALRIQERAGGMTKTEKRLLRVRETDRVSG